MRRCLCQRTRILSLLNAAAGIHPGPRVAALSSEWRTVPEYGALFNLQFCVSHNSPNAIYCRMLPSYGNLSETSSMRWLRPARFAGSHCCTSEAARTLHKVSARAHQRIICCVSAPAPPEDDFYCPAEAKEFFDPFLEALGIPRSAEKSPKQMDARAADLARLAEFQHRGYYLAYLSECPIRASEEPAASTIARLAPTLIRRIRFNYRPKHIAPLGQELNPLIELLRGEGIAPIVTQDQGLALPAPGTGPLDWMELFRRSVAAAAP